MVICWADERDREEPCRHIRSGKGDTHEIYLEVVGVTRQIFPAPSDAMKSALPSGAIATPLILSDVAPPAPSANVCMCRPPCRS